MPKKVYISRKGYASCPSCLNHIRLEDVAQETVCPFCEETLKVAAQSSEFGERALDVLRGSRTAIVATALAGAGLTLTVACGDPDPGDTNDGAWNISEEGDAGDTGDDVEVGEDPNQYNNYMDYGDFPNDENATYPDAGTDDVDEGEDVSEDSGD